MISGRARWAPSPNVDARRPGEPPWAVVIHYTGMTSAASALARLRDPAAKVSAHYLIDERGALDAMVDEERRAWHAGRGQWRGERDVNAISIGIELANPGRDWGYRPFPPAQIRALLALLAELVARWPIKAGDVIAHSDLAPDRKEDPGELFPWQALAGAGFALWTPRFRADPRSDVAAPWADLAELGYATARFERAALTRAFQRRHRPWRVDGVFDRECGARLARLLRRAKGDEKNVDDC